MYNCNTNTTMFIVHVQCMLLYILPLSGTGEGQALSEPGHLQVCIACIIIYQEYIIY